MVDNKFVLNTLPLITDRFCWTQHFTHLQTALILHYIITTFSYHPTCHDWLQNRLSFILLKSISNQAAKVLTSPEMLIPVAYKHALANELSTNECRMDSGLALHVGHNGFTSTFRMRNLSFVGKHHVTARHKKCLIVGGIYQSSPSSPNHNIIHNSCLTVVLVFLQKQTEDLSTLICWPHALSKTLSICNTWLSMSKLALLNM